MDERDVELINQRVAAVTNAAWNRDAEATMNAEAELGSLIDALCFQHEDNMRWRMMDKFAYQLLTGAKLALAAVVAIIIVTTILAVIGAIQ